MMKKLISASILSADFSNLSKDIKQCEEAGVDWIHIDVMDGHFVPNLTMGPVIVEACRKLTKLPLDCHLMVEKPELLVKSFADAGANYITIHPEDNPNVLRTLQLINSLGCHPGIALNPGTNTTVLDPLLPFTDMVLIMTVNPGFSGQSFIPEMVIKVSTTAEMIRNKNRDIRLEVDGGINPILIPDLIQAGANTFVSASSIFKHPDGIFEGVHLLREAMDKKNYG
jgi:ribulose-phosphate 3-epimerase